MWNAVAAIASVISMIAFVATALFVAAQLKALEKSRYLQVTSELYASWQSREFMDAQLWVIHKLEETTWATFIATHRADYGEQAFHRVGSFYDRVGTLIRLGLVDDREILSTIGAYAIAVWRKVEPLVREARRIENSTLFDDFERMMPACYECYVPDLKDPGAAAPFTLPTAGPQATRDAPPTPPSSAPPPTARLTTLRELRRALDARDAVTILDVRRHPPSDGPDARRLPGAIRIDPDEVAARWGEIPADRPVVAYCT